MTFWSLGSLNGATWSSVATVGIGILPALLLAPRLASSLDAWLLGETEARHLGVNIQRLKSTAVCITALTVGVAVSVAGLIGFIGLMIPHLVRMVIGPGHRYLLPCSAILGSLVLLISDLVARSLIAPIEIPIGIVTAMIGGPFFLYLLQRGGERGFLT